MRGRALRIRLWGSMALGGGQRRQWHHAGARRHARMRFRPIKTIPRSTPNARRYARLTRMCRKHCRATGQSSVLPRQAALIISIRSTKPSINKRFHTAWATAALPKISVPGNSARLRRKPEWNEITRASLRVNQLVPTQAMVPLSVA